MMLAFSTQTLLLAHLGHMAVNSPTTLLDGRELQRSAGEQQRNCEHRARTTGTTFTVLLLLF
jgi:hypothetical protein